MERSVLYNLEPMGIDTPNIESLSSYIIRLSKSHFVTTGILMSKVINPNLLKPYLLNIDIKGGEGFYKSSNAVNGNGKIAIDFKQVVESLTGRKDLINTTLLKYEKLLPSRNLLREKRAWCPQCFEEMGLNGTIYEPKIWSFSIVPACLIHKIKLIEHCPKCQKRLNFLSRNSNPGFCSNCNKWLGCKEVKVIHNNPPTNHQLKTTEFISNFIYWGLKDKRHYKREDIATSLKFLVEEYFEGNVSLAAKKLCFSKTTFSYWIRGINRPTLKTISSICNSMGMSFEDLINLNMKRTKIIISEGQLKNRNERPKYDHKRIKQLLEHTIKKRKYLSISKIADEIGCDRRLLSRNFPRECSLIIENNKNIKAILRVERFINYFWEIEKAFLILINNNEYPSFRKMEKLIGDKVLREEAFKQVFKDLKQKYLMG